MVYGFVQQSNGRVEVESASGEGTTIRIYLPRAPGEASEQPADKQDPMTSPFGEGQVALVVEDDPAVRQVAVSTLKAMGFEVHEAETGDEAANLLKQNGQGDWS